MLLLNSKRAGTCRYQSSYNPVTRLDTNHGGVIDCVVLSHIAVVGDSVGLHYIAVSRFLPVTSFSQTFAAF